MKKNTVERFSIETIHRNTIHGAPYNPRKISESAAKKLRKEMRSFGLMSPIIVNRATMNIVYGHQRIDAMDALMRIDDYELTVSMVELSEAEEIKANVLLNNQGVMGEWDIDKLAELKELIPDLDFKDDLGFDQADMDVMFAGMDALTSFDTPQEEKTEIEHMAEIDAFKAAKKSQRENIKNQEAETGDTWAVANDDNLLTIVFNTNAEKRDFMKRARRDPKEKFIKPSILWDIASGKINLVGKA